MERTGDLEMPAKTTTRRGQNRKGQPATAAQQSALKKGRKAADKKRTERAQQRKAEMEVPRWKQLEDGTISVRDLTMEELARRQCANNDGTWEGRRHTFSPAWQNRLTMEFHRRFRQQFDELAPLALEALEQTLQDEENPAQRWAATKLMIEYQQGKVPDVLVLGTESEFDRLQQSAFRIERGADAVTVDDAEDVVDAEIVEEAG